jgi:hypothetical protein
MYIDDLNINNDGKLDYINGSIKLVLTLPGKQEKCEFTLKLLNDTIANVIDYLKVEDKSIEKAQFYTMGIQFCIHFYFLYISAC